MLVRERASHHPVVVPQPQPKLIESYHEDLKDSWH